MNYKFIALKAFNAVVILFWHRCEESNSWRRVLEARDSTSYLYATPTYWLLVQGSNLRPAD